MDLGRSAAFDVGWGLRIAFGLVDVLMSVSPSG